MSIISYKETKFANNKLEKIDLVLFIIADREACHAVSEDQQLIKISVV